MIQELISYIISVNTSEDHSSKKPLLSIPKLNSGNLKLMLSSVIVAEFSKNVSLRSQTNPRKETPC
jgi:hypothetical protein